MRIKFLKGIKGKKSMTNLYEQQYISRLKKNRTALTAAFFVLCALWAAAYILSITIINSLAVSLIIAAAGVLWLAVFYILLICPISAVIKALREADSGLKNEERMNFIEYGDEQLKGGVYYIAVKVSVPDEHGRAQERELLVQKGLEPNLIRGESFIGRTFQRVLLGYEKNGAENP